jgi:hypothetical protein
LRIAQHRNDRDRKTRQEFPEHLKAEGVAANAIRDDRHLVFAPVELDVEQQFGNQLRRSMDIDRRRCDRDQNTVRQMRICI